MNDELPISLNRALTLAISSSNSELREEEGGFIIKKVGTQEYEFHKVHNQNSGTTIAVALYTADAQEYGDKILAKTNTLKWEEDSSFHTHPHGCSARPSMLDLNELFKGFRTNYIYAKGTKDLMRYDFDNQNKVWQARQIKLQTNPS